MEYDVEVVELEPQDTAVFRGRVEHGAFGDFLGLAFRQVMGALGAAPVVGPPFARYTMAGDAFEVEAGFPTAGPFEGAGQVEGSSLPGGSVARTLHVGSYQGLGAAYSALEGYLGEHGLVPAGDPWETYLDEPSAAEPRTFVCWPCTAA